MDTVLGVSMAPTTVRMVLVEGENGDGATVDQDNFDLAEQNDAPTLSAADRVVSAILGTREGAAESGYQLASTGVTFTDPIEAAALRDALAAHKVENVMLVSAFLAAAALAQAVGSRTNYAQTALLYIEPDTATLAVVDSADGSIANVHREALAADDDAAVTQLASMASAAEALETRPDGLFVVGTGIDVGVIKPALQAATTLPVTAPEEPDTALARGAALASAQAPLFASSTAARAYAQDPGYGAVGPSAVAPEYLDMPDGTTAGPLAYSAVPDEFADAYADVHTGTTRIIEAAGPGRRSFGLVGSAVATIFIVGVAALAVSIAVAVRPTAGVRSDPGHKLIVPAHAPVPAASAPALAAPAPAPAASVPQAAAPAPQVPARVPRAPVESPASAPVARAPVVEAPAPASAPQAVAPAPAPQAPAPAPAPEAPASAPVPDAPAPEAPAVEGPVPAPVPAAPAPAPIAPLPVPVPIPLPIIGGPPVGGFGPGGGRFGPGGPGAYGPGGGYGPGGEYGPGNRFGPVGPRHGGLFPGFPGGPGRGGGYGPSDEGQGGYGDGHGRFGIFGPRY